MSKQREEHTEEMDADPPEDSPELFTAVGKSSSAESPSQKTDHAAVDKPSSAESPSQKTDHAEQAGSWANDAVECEENAAEGSAVIEIPDALRRLENSGVRFETVKKHGFTTDGLRTTLKKNLSVYFTVDTICTSQDIIYGLDAAGIDVDDIKSIQRKGSNRSWVVTFSEPGIKEHALGLASISIAGCQVFLGDCQNRTVLFKIYECPDEMPDTFLIGRLSRFGSVLSFRRDLLSTGIRNGIRTARMRLVKAIPSSIMVAGELIYVSYPSQPRTCRKCGDSGHMANSCNSIRCFNCEQSGHRIEDCEETEVCKICHDASHATCYCPFFVFSADVVSKDQLDMQIQTELIDDLDLSLTDHERELCEGLFTKEELSAALNGLQTGKTPGSDGLPTFPLAFWSDLEESLLAVLNECYKVGSMFLNPLFGLSFGTAKWRMLVVSGAVPPLSRVGSTLLTLMLSVLVCVCLIFKG